MATKHKKRYKYIERDLRHEHKIRRRRLIRVKRGLLNPTGFVKIPLTPITYAPRKSAKPIVRPPQPAKILHERHEITPHSLDSLARKKTCKKRPDAKKATRGAGGSRKFIPWCKKS